MQIKKIMVNHEWDRLREVIVGCPYARMGTDIPRYLSNFMPQASLSYLRDALSRFQGRRLDEAQEDLYRMMTEQMDRVIRILEERSIVVHRLKPFEAPEESYLQELSFNISMQAFPRDPIVVIGNTLIETAMYAPYRRKERFSIRRTLGERLAQSDVRILSMPEPCPMPEGPDGYGPGAFLEGGDVFVMGRDIYVGNTGNASSRDGIRWLQGALGNGYTVHEVMLSRKFLHLDCVLAIPRPGLALVCKAGFTRGLPLFLKGWDLIEITPEDAERKLAANVLVLDEKTVITACEAPEVADALARAGQDVITTSFGAISMWGGAFRCWHHPLLRES